MPTEIKGFSGQYRFLSNFFMVEISDETRTYKSVEHYFQSHKTLDLRDSNWIASQPSCAKAKQAGGPHGLDGHKITKRENWEAIKEDVMLTGLRLKFAHPHLRGALLDTGDAYLEETNTWTDTYWGVYRGKGKNRLGHLLMQVREELRQQ